MLVVVFTNCFMTVMIVMAVVMVMPAMTVMPVSMNPSVMFEMALKSVSLGAVGRPMAIIIFFVMTPVMIIPTAAMVRRFMISVVPVMGRSEMLVLLMIMMPVFSAIRPGSASKQKNCQCRYHAYFQ